MLAGVNAMESSLVHFRCVRPGHQSSNADVSDRVFIYEMAWAYCPAGRRGEDHRFLPTGGTTRRQLEAGVSTGAKGISST